ncbi:hypothetical protein ATE68_17800 [Sphingopyxis sp. H038]|nr:hypothetical protein ATE78_10615 [Sphingopyxis sp. H012]KTE09698.1 hypothetical protein ATE70_12630 [Sphingopyxis sp. H053]KTE15092.1 hypothetical protein ATE76_04085 [Sphingopyxis sp. H093]KTE29801.1 hypothetical protein ATE75_05080 [Sphingopyxis sp. H080]KTE32970.1 hypothetical protein ATE68_17800 [Sphingopyxis sp. H038]KTE43188.1 hypothetical protein ATE77_11710 [Sphingopyxis sp. H005]KTE43785.1 hypothetical protein ATE73_12335 [Sphingopyxis sp. H077]KTE70394.1 hypothetical protein ATE
MMASLAPCLPGDGWRLGLERPPQGGAPVSCLAKDDPTLSPPIPAIPKGRTKFPFPDILMRYGKAMILRMEMLARRR